MKFELYNGGKKVEVEVSSKGEDLAVSFGGKTFNVRLVRDGSADAMVASVDGKDSSVVLEEETETRLRLTVDGRPITLARAQAQLQAGSIGPAASPMPVEQNALVSPLFGKVISVDVKAGESVDSGQSLVVLEAMKMESVLRADGKHVIKEVLVKEGDGVQKGQLIMRFD
jgi:acetyl/propionyl-CoA carboxylase alpha subunit